MTFWYRRSRLVAREFTKLCVGDDLCSPASNHTVKRLVHLRLMYSQATVRSYTKDRAVLRWDHTLKRGKVKGGSRNQHHRNHSCGNLRRPHWTLALCVFCGGKGTAPGCAHSVGAQRYQATILRLLEGLRDELV